MKIGLLIPTSYTYPKMQVDFINGLELGLGEAGISSGDYQLLQEDIDLGTDRKIVEKKARKLCLQEEVNVLCSFAGSVVSHDMESLSADLEVPVLNVDTGAKSIFENISSPYFTEHSMQLWQSCWAMGTHAATLGKTLVVVSNFYEAGYMLTSGFCVAFEKNGGKVLKVGITKDKPTEENVPPLVQEINELKPDLLLFAFSGKNGARFLKMYRELATHNCLIFSTALTCEDDILPSQENLSLDIVSAMSWSLHLDTPENKKFVEVVIEKTGRAANSFVLLGYEAGNILGQAWTRSNKTTNAAKLTEAIKQSSVSGPRGLISFKQNSKSTTLPHHYLRQVHKGPDGNYNKVLQEVFADDDALEQMKEAMQGIAAGWINAYPCA